MKLLVARVLDSHTIVINHGIDQGITPGVELLISDPIIDPASGLHIGDYPNVRVKVVEVHDKFCVAKTIGKRKGTAVVNIGDEVRRC